MKKPVPKQTRTNPNSNYVLTSKVFNRKKTSPVNKVANTVHQPVLNRNKPNNASFNLSNMYSLMRLKSGPCRSCGHR